MEPSPTAPASRLHAVTGEFRDRERERQFRASTAHKVRQDSRLALIVGAAITAMFGISDYGFLGLSQGFYQLLAVRAVMVLGCLGLAWRLSTSSVFLPRPWLLSAGPLLLSTGMFLILAIRPGTINTQMMCVVVVVVGFYLFVPNLVAGMLASSIYLTVGFLIGAVLWAKLPAVGLLTFGVLLLAANLVGSMAARRLARLQREQFTLLKDEQLAKSRLIEEIARRGALEERLRAMAQTDELTGLSNRRHFMQAAEAALTAARAQDRPLSLCMIDVDHFKQINDTFGHNAGDRILQAVASACRLALREGEPLGRFGGEEFVALLPGADLDRALPIAERLRQRIADLRFAGLAADLRVTVTIGLSAIQAQEEALDAALQRADAALYEGKRGGRNIVRVSDEASARRRPARSAGQGAV